MAPNSISYWKRLWRWTTSMSLTEDDLLSVLGSKEVKEELKLGLGAYKPLKSNDFKDLQSKHPDQAKLLSIVQNLQQYIDVDCFQIWEVIKHYLCDISYGTPENALKNTAFVDTRPVFLLPNIWKFYYRERLFLLKLVQHIVEYHDDPAHKYKDVFNQIVTDIGLQNLKSSLIDQFDKLLSTAPPAKKIKNDLSSDTVLVEWAKSNVREQLAILQTLVLIADQVHFLPEEFLRLVELFRKHGFGKKQGFASLLDERDRDASLNIMRVELCLFLVLTDGDKKKCVTTFMEATGARVEAALGALRASEEHAVMLLAWMMLSLQSDKFSRQFESRYQHFGTTALRLRVFEFLHQVVSSAVISDKSRCAAVARSTIFSLLGKLCQQFDGDGTLGRQAGALPLCAALLAGGAAAALWRALPEGSGVASLWSTALELFPHDFGALTTLAGGLARAGSDSVDNLLAELDSLPVYTEVYDSAAVPVSSLRDDEATLGRDYYPLNSPSYRVPAGSKATIMERKEATLIHYRTPYSYWTIFIDEVDKALDRKRHHQFNVEETMERVCEGTKLLADILTALPPGGVPRALLAPSEAACAALVRPARAAQPPPLAAAGLRLCAALARAYPHEMHSRLLNTGLLPRVPSAAAPAALAAGAAGAALAPGAVGAWLPGERARGDYRVLCAYLDLLLAFHESTSDPRITADIVLPGVVLVLREVFPSAQAARYAGAGPRRALLTRCVRLLAAATQAGAGSGAGAGAGSAADALRRVCVFSVLHTENAVELLKIVRVGNDELEDIMAAETNWVSGEAQEYIATLQRALATLMLALKHKTLVTPAGEVTPLEQLIFSQSQKALQVVPRVTSYINNAFSKHLAALGCCLLKRFAETFQMSLFASLDMTSYQVRVMFLARLRDAHESVDLKVAILEFVATCVGKQPGLTEAFFKLNHVREKAEGDVKVKAEDEDSFEGILGYMADYLGSVKEDSKLLHSPLLACVMTLFHALWKNNMQVLVRELRDNPAFWTHLTAPLFAPVLPRLRTYAQIYNVLGIELFTSRETVDDNLKEMLEKLFDIDSTYLDTWIRYIYSFAGRDMEEEVVDKVPAWLGLLTSWKDFTTIFCKFLPISLNIAHKTKLVAPCLSALLSELDDVRDGRLVVILSELYVTMLANWKEDCFDDRKANAQQMETLLTNTAVVYDCLHPRAKRAILSIGTVAISSLDFEVKANCAIGQNIIRAVTGINSYELEKLFDRFTSADQPPEGDAETPPVVISLALLEQCLELYDDMFSGLAQWFQTTRFTNKLLCCLQMCLQDRRHYQTSLAALRCLTAYARGPFSKDLLLSDIDQFLWLALLPPQFEGSHWRLEEWWKVYGCSLDFISLMVARHGEFFATDAVTFVGVHLEHLVEAILVPRHTVTEPALALSAAALHLAVRLLRYEPRWRLENVNSLETIMAATSANLQQCVMLMLRLRRSADAPAAAAAAPATPASLAAPAAPGTPATPAAPAATAAPSAGNSALLQKTLELLHMSTVALIGHSPSLLTLLAAAPAPEPARADLDFTAPAPGATRLTFGTLLCAVCVRARSLNHTYAAEEASGARRRRGASASPRGARSESTASVSSCASAALPAPQPQPHALEAALTLLAQQALLALRDPAVPARHKQLIRRELSSELAVFHDFVRRRVLGAAPARPLLDRNKPGAWPLAPDERETKMLEQYARERLAGDADALPPPPPPKRASTDSMREYILRKHYLTKCAQTPLKEPPSPVSHSTPTSDKKKERTKRVSWAETTRHSDHDHDSTLSLPDDVYSGLTDVQIGDEDYFHFMSVVFLWICQMEL